MPKSTAEILNTKIDGDSRLLAIVHFKEKSPKVGDTINVEWGSSRSNLQNNLYWKILEIISEHTRHSKEELHEFFKAKFLGDKIEIMDEPFICSRSTTKLTIDEFSKYLSDIRFYVFEKLTIDLPLE